MLEIIEKIVYEATGKGHLTLDTDFVKDLELNSFDIMNVIGGFEDYYNVSIETREVWQLHQVKDVIAYLKKNGITE